MGCSPERMDKEMCITRLEKEVLDLAIKLAKEDIVSRLMPIASTASEETRKDIIKSIQERYMALDRIKERIKVCD